MFLQQIVLLFLNILIFDLSCAKPQGSLSVSTTCNVIESSSGESKPCIFPFKINSETFYSCTNYEDSENRYWCSTKVKDDGYHIGNGEGFWGYCPDECLTAIATPTTPKPTTPTAATPTTATPTTATPTTATPTTATPTAAIPTTATPSTATPTTTTISANLEASEGLKKALADIVGGKAHS